jgi:hypothetical protein
MPVGARAVFLVPFQISVVQHPYPGGVANEPPPQLIAIPGALLR